MVTKTAQIEFDWFKDDGIFMPMLNDHDRNSFYQQSLARCSRDKTVVDIGAGTGLLSFLAVKAGARHVYAVEKDPGRYEYLLEMVTKLGLNSKITCINDDWLNLDIPAEIYVSETINTQIFGEDILLLADHAQRHGGLFIPGRFEITATIYKHHPVFVLDQTHPDSWKFDPKIDIHADYEKSINHDFQQRHALMDTLYQANQLNKLFTLLPRFNDLRIEKLWQGQPLIVDLNRPRSQSAIELTIPTKDLPTNTDWYMVLFWQAKFEDIVMDCKDVWFGNVSKTIEQSARQPGTDIITWYNESKRNWQVIF
jgi:SAM-dependent methyltransferase